MMKNKFKRKTRSVRQPQDPVTGLLATLADGRDADGIAAFLQVRGIRGLRSMQASCPIAHYLGPAPGLELVYVSWAETECGFGSVRLRIKNPPQVREFISNFDRGRYPELVPTIEQLEAEMLAIVSAARARVAASSPAGVLTSANQ
jgi:hypothetical protein